MSTQRLEESIQEAQELLADLQERLIVLNDPVEIRRTKQDIKRTKKNIQNLEKELNKRQKKQTNTSNPEEGKSPNPKKLALFTIPLLILVGLGIYYFFYTCRSQESTVLISIADFSPHHDPEDFSGKLATEIHRRLRNHPMPLEIAKAQLYGKYLNPAEVDRDKKKITRYTNRYCDYTGVFILGHRSMVDGEPYFYCELHLHNLEKALAPKQKPTQMPSHQTLTIQNPKTISFQVSEQSALVAEFVLANILYHQGEYEEAISKFKACETKPNAEDKQFRYYCKLYQGNSLVKQEKYKEAEQTYQEASKILPNHPDTEANLTLIEEIIQDQPASSTHYPEEDKDTTSQNPDNLLDEDQSDNPSEDTIADKDDIPPPKTKNFNTYTETVNGVSFTMIAVQGGTFQMGSENGEDDEKPIHKVSLSQFYMAETEVTQELYQAIMGTNPSRFKNCPQCPVEKVNWNDAQAFIQKLNQLTGKSYSLPTEAQWEYAARGGTLSKGYKYAGSNDLGTVAWYGSNSTSKTHPVRSKQANELGLYDMSGNVWEWCQDWYNGEYYQNSPGYNPQGPTGGSFRVYRGGSWYRRCRFLSGC